MSPFYTERRPNHNLMYTVDHTFGYHSTHLLCACLESSAHAPGTKFRGRNFKHFKISKGNGQFATDSHGHKRTSDSDPRTRMFHQTLITAGERGIRIDQRVDLFYFGCYSYLGEDRIIVHTLATSGYRLLV